MTVRSCRDCANYEERRDIDGTSLCAKKIGPYVCCEEFKLKDDTLNSQKFFNKFCVECTNFDYLAKVALCSKKHSPGTGCDSFRSRTVKLDATRQNNRFKTAILAHVAKENSDCEALPAYVTVIKRKIKW